MAGAGRAFPCRPFSISSKVALIPIRLAKTVWGAVKGKGRGCFYDDRDERPGAKFATADLIGIPWQVLVGPKSLAEGKVELKRRSDGTRELLTPNDVLSPVDLLRVIHCNSFARARGFQRLELALNRVKSVAWICDEQVNANCPLCTV